MLRNVVGFSPLGLPGSILGTSDGTTPEPTHTHHTNQMFIFDESYDRDNTLPPQDIREDFSGLTFEHGMDPQVLLDQLACFLPASVLAEFMDDLANGRV